MRKSLRLIGAGALLFAGSFLGSYLAHTQGLEKTVREEVEKTRLEVRIALPFGADTLFTIPDTFSSREEFDDDSEDYDYWKTKTGFRYETDNLENGIGTWYGYGIDSDILQGAVEHLRIVNYNDEKGRFDSSEIFIMDANRDAIPDYISIEDSKNNTSISILRSKTILGTLGGYTELKYDGCNQETARSLFDLYTARFQYFKKIHHIGERIDAYVPRMEIVEINLQGN